MVGNYFVTILSSCIINQADIIPHQIYGSNSESIVAAYPDVRVCVYGERGCCGGGGEAEESLGFIAFF